MRFVIAENKTWQRDFIYYLAFFRLLRKALNSNYFKNLDHYIEDIVERSLIQFIDLLVDLFIRNTTFYYKERTIIKYIERHKMYCAI